MNTRSLCLLSSLLCCCFISFSHADDASSKRSIDAAFSSIHALDFEVLRRLPHDPETFTEGLEMMDGKLLESSGLYGRSALILREIARSEPLMRYPLPREIFGEGVTVFRHHIYQLSWREQLALVFDERFKLLTVMPYQGEGWGLSHDSQNLIMSDGSARLSFRSADDLRLLRVLEVRAGQRAVPMLNELEYAHGLIFANVWRSNTIVLIDPNNGQVRARLDLSSLQREVDAAMPQPDAEAVANGIAWDPARDVFYITGKRWPWLYELRIRGPLPTTSKARNDAKR